MPNETKHTPGPWRFAQNQMGHITFIIAPADQNGAIGEIYGQDEGAMANARLIAAAPDLLGILKRMTEWAGGMDADRLPPPWPEMVAEATKAIAKAEGREKGESE